MSGMKHHPLEKIVFTAEDVRQFTYCPRIIYFRYVMNVNMPPRTYKMEKGIEKHEKDVRNFKSPPESSPQKYANIYLKDERVGLIALLDFLEVDGDEAIPIDLKTGKRYQEPISDHHFAQLVAQALLVEACMGQIVRRVRVDYTRLKKVLERQVDVDDKFRVLRDLERMQEIVETEIIPSPTNIEGKCTDCEFWRYCLRV
ncbi:MAG: CRISPR-associated protein Cas4, partial [Candidatus Helarchaeota archaeon]